MSPECTHDPRRAYQFQWRKDAAAAALAIRWPASSAQSVDVMGFRLWVIGDDHCRYLTRAGYDALVAQRKAGQ